MGKLAKGLKYNLGVRTLRKLAGKKTRSRNFLPLDKVKTVMLAYDEYQTTEAREKKAIQKFIAFLNEKQKAITTVIYFHKRKAANIPASPDDNTIHLSKNDFNSLGMPKTTQVKKLMAEPYDYFINLNLDGRMPLKSIAGFTSATCRIGYNRDKATEFYDIILGDPDKPKIELYIADLEFYLQKIG